MATLSAQATSGTAGAALTFASCAGGGDKFTISGKERVMVKNASGGSLTFKLTAQSADEYGETTDVTYTVADGATFITPRLAKRRFADASGFCLITYPGGVTSLTIAVVGSAS